MGLVDSAIAFGKGIGRLLKWLLLLPFRIPLQAYRTLRSLRGTSPATKALLVLVVALAGLAGAGFLFALQSDMEVSASSAPLVSAILEWATSGWGYVFAALVFGRGTIWGVRKARIAKAARESGYNPRTIARLADEIRTIDGTARAIIFGDDDLEAASERIDEAFEGEDDRIAFDDGGDPPSDQSAVTLPVPAEESDTSTSDEDQEAEQDGPSNAERFKLWRMDLATALRADDIVWKLLIPTAIVFVIELVLVRFWVQWWLYPSLLALALLVGVGVYRGDQWLRGRRLRSLRQERGGETWEEIAVLVKTVETDEVTVHMGFLAGRTYASKDREDLVETLATRALERSYGYHPSPAIEERYAWCLDRYILNFAGWRENMEKPQVMDDLVNTVLNSEEGLVPKEVLVHRVVEHDREYIWQGLRYVGMGYDPDLVAECYAQLVPNTLVEHEFSIQKPGDDHQVTGVRARTETLPPDVAKLRASFSERFANQMPDRYSLPAVEPDESTRGFHLPSGE